MKSHESPCLVCQAPTSHKTGKCKVHRQKKCVKYNCKRMIEQPHELCEKHRRGKKLED